VRTTLTVDDDVAAKLRAEVRRSGQSLKYVVNHFLRLGLTARRRMRPAPPFVVKSRQLGLRPGLNYDNVGELLEQVEGELHR
jgi:hypothetical protein